MAQVVLHPSRQMRSALSSNSSQIVMAEHAVKLTGTASMLIIGIAAVLDAEVEAFQHLPKEQQVLPSVAHVL
jgi:hypothetical protein